ncbi:hypothetical protein [Lichenicoccus sp.]|uniref:hypothetical protein n=1 Tax=Lichenicoccus sp. TaxID=2781899 RepID=UPI003D127033
MKRVTRIPLLLAALAVSAAAPPPISAEHYGVTLTTEPRPVTIERTASEAAALHEFRIVNSSGDGTSAWCTRAGHDPAPNAAGSYEIPPGHSEEFRRDFPESATWCVAASGTVALAIDIY